MKRYLILSLGFLALARPLAAAQLEGVTLPDTVTVAGKALQLNGIGLRTATIFKVNVYVAGLYVPGKSTKEDALLAAPGPKQMTLHFLRDVDKKKIASTWEDSLKPVKEKFGAEIEALTKLMASVSEGDKMTYTFLPDAVEVKVNDSVKGNIAGAEFGRAMLATWIGEKPPTEKLKRGLLGTDEKH